MVATLYFTIYSILCYYKTKKHIYLVQGYETDFYSYGSFFRGVAEKHILHLLILSIWLYQNVVKVG